MSNITYTINRLFLIVTLFAFSVSMTFAQTETAMAVVTAKRTSPSISNVTDFEGQARFPGCEAEGSGYSKLQCSEAKLEDFIKKNIAYPIRSKSSDFKGKVVKVAFTVESNGMIHSFKIPKPNIKEFDINALAVFEKMAETGIKWIPATKEGEPTRTKVSKNVQFDVEGRNKAFPSASMGDDVYELVDEVPAFPTCKSAQKKDREILDCTLESLNGFFKENMNYPEDALTVGLEGDIDVEFIVDANGLVRNAKIQNDLGLGTGEEAFRLMLLMNDKNIGWIAGEEDGAKVNVLLSTSIHFRIDPSAIPKSKLKLMDAKPVFITEREGFEDYMKSTLKYPVGDDVDPCQSGVIDMQFKVKGSQGNIEITKVMDFNNLGKEFKASATDFIQATKGDWNVDYANLSTVTEYYVSIPFQPNKMTCPIARGDYKEMVYKALEGAEQATKKAKLNEGLTLLDEALRLYPADNKMRFLRGNILYKAGRHVEGCVDLSFVNKQNKDIVVPKSCK